MFSIKQYERPKYQLYRYNSKIRFRFLNFNDLMPIGGLFSYFEMYFNNTEIDFVLKNDL